MNLAGTSAETDSTSIAAVLPEFSRNEPFGRFEGSVELSYRAWALDQALPVVRLVGSLSVLIWVFGPFVVERLLDRDAPPESFAICWGVNVTVLLVALAVSYRRPRVWHAAFALTVIALGSLLLVDWIDVPESPTAMIALTLFYIYLAPVMQFPFRSTLVVLGTILPATIWYSWHLNDHGGTAGGGLAFLTWVLCAASGFAVAMSALSENNNRRRYAGEQTLARRQEQLVASRALIRRYAPPAVADRLEHGDHTVDTPQRRRVTVLFADVVGFTTMADRLDPEALAEIMNDYLGATADIVERHGGTLNEFAGDGVMALFGAPDDMEPAAQVLAALEAARHLQRSLPTWSQRWYSLGIDEALQARIGVNTGVVSVGTFGSAVRATYTGIGLQTNIAARIQAQCPPGSVLLSKTSWHLVSDSVPCEPRGEVEVKGVHFPIAMYEPTKP